MLSTCEAKLEDSIDEGVANLAAYRSMQAALEGNFAPLSGRLRSNAKLRRDEREFLADIMDGTIKKPTRKVMQQRLKLTKKRQIGQFILIGQIVLDCKLEAAIQLAISLYRISRRYAFESLQELKSDPLRLAATKICGNFLRDVRLGLKSFPDETQPIPKEKIFRFRVATPLLYVSARTSDQLAP